MLKNLYLLGLYCAGMFVPVQVGAPGSEGSSPPKTPEEELATFRLPPGLKIQLVAAEPLVQDPVVMTFDPDGRLWVVEMRGFMPTIDGEGEDQPSGRISVLEDTDGDGTMDKSTIYLDSLLMPRALALVPGGALVAENQSLWLTQDTNGDLKADSKTLLDADYAGSPLPEHSGNGLWRGMDNYYYNVKSRFRYRLTNGKWLRDSTEFRGQWGVSHDDEGHLFYNYNWSQLHADLVPPNALTRNQHHAPTSGIDHGLTIDRRVYPIRPNPAVNRGYIPGTLDAEGKLLEFTAACSPLVYREKTLPTDYQGNAFVCEPAGNLIKRNVVQKKGFLLEAFDPTPGTEFLASTDERFRPVHLATGPDGALYIADMYRGLIQHGAYVTPYLREQTLSRGLVLPVHLGRIWRIVPENWQPAKPQKLSAASSSELVTQLSNSNGWHRDIAQRLLVERNDPTSVANLRQLALNGTAPFGRFHALWTLDGMKKGTAELYLAALSDPHPLVQSTALRLLDPWAKKDEWTRKALEMKLKTLASDPSPELSLQLALSVGAVSTAVSFPIFEKLLAIHGEAPLMRDAVLSSLQNQEYSFLRFLTASPTWQEYSQPKEIFLEMLTTAIYKKRNATELNALLTTINQEKAAFGWHQKTILTALAIQANSGKPGVVALPKAPVLFLQPKNGPDPGRVTALKGLFSWPGHKPSRTVVAQTAHPLNDEDRKQFTLGRQQYLTTCAGCHGTDGAGLNRFAPPLVGSEWVLGDEKRLSLILLHGMEGPVDVLGKKYDAPEILPVMPSHSTMDDGALTAILTYIRNEWGNAAGPVNKRVVGTTRHTSQGRVVPWTAHELNQHIEKTKTPQGNQK
ncbi:DUF7133 domain-containing protein [Arundinibacter roseus]|uniref:Dehydrogenase n=1 Tax=Arundinibacter roseus TaxID=2070510 RepID=A0A4R4KNH9_9BACT|nr:c-type cytochrome [Arundinibacter roseus]TDB68121.1 dehydrogenase [Arundinibacter roseus]